MRWFKQLCFSLTHRYFHYAMMEASVYKRVCKPLGFFGQHFKRKCFTDLPHLSQCHVGYKMYPTTCAVYIDWEPIQMSLEPPGNRLHLAGFCTTLALGRITTDNFLYSFLGSIQTCSTDIISTRPSWSKLVDEVQESGKM